MRCAQGSAWKRCCIRRGAARQYPQAVETLLAACEQAAEITEPLAGYIGDTATPQGIFGIAGIPAGMRPLDNDGVFAKINKNGRYIALEDVQDPVNLGTVIRTAEALGLDGMLLSSGCCDLLSPKVLRGAWRGVPSAVFPAGGFPGDDFPVGGRRNGLLGLRGGRGGRTAAGNGARRRLPVRDRQRGKRPYAADGAGMYRAADHPDAGPRRIA